VLVCSLSVFSDMTVPLGQLQMSQRSLIMPHTLVSPGTYSEPNEVTLLSYDRYLEYNYNTQFRCSVVTMYCRFNTIIFLYFKERISRVVGKQ